MGNPYDDAHARSINDPDGFWAEAAEDVHWYKKWDKVLDDSNKPFYRWFTGGELNTCYNALDVHVEGGRGDQLALVYDSPVTDTIRRYTYAELRDETARAAGALVRTPPMFSSRRARSMRTIAAMRSGAQTMILASMGS